MAAAFGLPPDFLDDEGQPDAHGVEGGVAGGAEVLHRARRDEELALHGRLVRHVGPRLAGRQFEEAGDEDLRAHQNRVAQRLLPPLEQRDPHRDDDQVGPVAPEEAHRIDKVFESFSLVVVYLFDLISRPIESLCVEKLLYADDCS